MLSPIASKEGITYSATVPTFLREAATLLKCVHRRITVGVLVSLDGR